ncbi:16S rRNA (guanine(527)-N(7))-methyltransferase RsmG [Phytomonospora endophytica]|uniref:Ribosomal RNA small subunit methyltransferase G n=1 Tax=Phytomonospora endophytica TaxID=714109 RepID=A0A841FQM5_9ACTN|nr:16S rRNA (guanine(527)-N(7))-methyltransferase RsmG [Phytomonospora endophytica]MBB6038465.1 16S rRNA (guanine527-N7)-methyltransferase [Phytomonospora endophytica]GIG64394.1 ribosomal RNA small subunit methyltransferase G [Phytomonospora endophytica]
MSSQDETTNGPSTEGPFPVGDAEAAAGDSGAGAAADGFAPPPGLADTAAKVFGERETLAVAYAELLATDGVERGLIGPREVPRLWERHMLNCGVLAELIPEAVAVIDVGSGAGLPGIPLAIVRPDVEVMLVEPMLRRTVFLEEAVKALGLTNVTVFRGRAEDCDVAAPIVTARAVAALDKLARWCLPLVVSGGELLAMKGSSAQEEVTTHAKAVRKAGGTDAEVLTCGAGLLEVPTTIVRIRKR